MVKRKIRNGEKRLLDLNECCAYMGLGKSSVMKIASETGAKVKIGRRALYDKTTIDLYLDKIIAEQNS